MLKEEAAVLRAAYAYADALKNMNEIRTPDATRSYQCAMSDLAFAAAKLMDVSEEERSAMLSEADREDERNADLDRFLASIP